MTYACRDITIDSTKLAGRDYIIALRNGSLRSATSVLPPLPQTDPGVSQAVLREGGKNEGGNHERDWKHSNMGNGPGGLRRPGDPRRQCAGESADVPHWSGGSVPDHQNLQ